MIHFLSKLNHYYIHIAQYLSQQQYRFNIFMISSFIFLLSFFVLTKSNPYYFLLPYKIYSLNFKKEKDVVLFSFHRDTKEIIKFNLKINVFDNIEKEIEYIAKIIQEPTPYLRKIDSKTEKIYFPAFSLGITKVFLNNDSLWIFYDQNVIKDYLFQRKPSKEDKFDYYGNYKKALVLSIFENYSSIKEIQWIEEKETQIYKR